MLKLVLNKKLDLSQDTKLYPKTISKISQKCIKSNFFETGYYTLISMLKEYEGIFKNKFLMF